MFSGLGSSVRGKNHRVNFEQAILWSLKFFRKDDRIIWYLSIIQRFAFLKLLNGGKISSQKLTRKMNRKLKGFEVSRIIHDFEHFDQELWEHFSSVQAVYSHPLMLEYPFHEERDNRPVPKSAQQVLDDFGSFEKKLQDKEGDRFCNEGEIRMEFEDGWAWFIVENGFSRQEAIAMRHCGNGNGNLGDQLYSLREPIHKPHGICWKPHLTFILRKGYLGEMKGFANQKPNVSYNRYIKELLKLDEIEGIKGGGYLPQNNFEFLDLEKSTQIEVMEKKPFLEFDLIGNGGKTVLQDGKNGKWKHFFRANCPEQAMSYLNLDTRKEPEWLAFQSEFFTSKKKYHHTQAFCAYERGCVGKLHFTNEWIRSESLSKILYHPMVKVIRESLLVPDSTWDKVVDHAELKTLMKEKPGFFRHTALNLIFENFGCNSGFVGVINDQLNLNLKSLSDGIELLSFSSVRSFARRTGIGSLIRKSNHLSSLPDGYCSDLFQLGWMTFRKRNCPFSPIYLHLEKEAVMYLFSSLELSGSITPKELMRELIYLFGPPDIFQSPRLLVA